METIADYRLIRSLGAGSHGEFFLAEPPARLGLDTEFVAVKVTAGQTQDDAFRRATRELRLFAQVKSPYLVALYDAGQEGGRFFYAAEYLPLGSLGSPSKPLDRGQTLRVGRLVRTVAPGAALRALPQPADRRRPGGRPTCRVRQDHRIRAGISSEGPAGRGVVLDRDPRATGPAHRVGARPRRLVSTRPTHPTNRPTLARDRGYA